MFKFLIIDGFNLLFRCYHAVPELARRDGLPTNALHGWVRMLWKLEDAEKTDQVAVFFDLGGAEVRQQLYSQYKANRAEMPAGLAQQIPWAKRICEAHGYPVVELAGHEADDLMASAAVALAQQGNDVRVVSADKDFAQIVGQNISQLIPPSIASPLRTWRRRDIKGVQKKFGVMPAQIVDYLSLVGDTSDNIPGIAGVGPKTASRWLQQYGSLEAIIAQAETIKPLRFRALLGESADQLRLNQQLITLDCSLPVVDLVRQAPQPPKIFELLKQLEMTTTLRKAHQRFPLAVQQELPWLGTFFSGS